ncbi:uncharacterized protein LOC124355618 [Homalodisca vitripennis]|uniref:uncharacterized protein LOC124355618 n=1 Tax=Homalodisca vitripennis TaxID=197043 RepID=UPI001EEB8322|nr:uncharacterized protein LOC124355618 [Homalodisca vitripennis]
MTLNSDNCSVVSFRKTITPVTFDYHVAGQLLNRQQSAKDLGVLLRHDLNSEDHVRYVCGKAFRMLGMLSRVSRHLRDPHTLRAIYSAHVQPFLEYSSAVWAPHQDYLRQDLQRVQRKFIRIVGFRMGFNYDEVPVSDLERALNVNSLEERRDVQDAMFLFKLVTSAIDSPFLLERVSFICHGRTRSMELFARRNHNSSLEANCTMQRV